MEVGVLFDLDQTLVDSSIALAIRGKGPWEPVYKLVPGFVVYPGIADLLAMLAAREVPLGIVTTSPRHYCTKVITYHGIAIEKLVCFREAGNIKPHRDPIRKGIELLELPSGNVWAIGDDAKDIRSAHDAGAHAVAVTWGSVNAVALRAAGAEAIFDSVAELHTFLDDLTAPDDQQTEDA